MDKYLTLIYKPTFFHFSQPHLFFTMHKLHDGIARQRIAPKLEPIIILHLNQRVYVVWLVIFLEFIISYIAFNMRFLMLLTKVKIFVFFSKLINVFTSLYIKFFGYNSNNIFLRYGEYGQWDLNRIKIFHIFSLFQWKCRSFWRLTASEILEQGRWQTLCKSVCILHWWGNMKHFNKSHFYLFKNKMKIDLYMFSSLVLNMVCRKVNRTDIVKENQWCSLNGTMNFQQ